MNNNMMLNFVGNEQIQEIHEAALEILSKYGMKVQDPKVRELMEGYGCETVDDRVKIPSSL
ncbi:MAG: trimethylamine methyltransferase family protein, partial [Peptostreptococcaceae bacterium]